MRFLFSLLIVSIFSFSCKKADPMQEVVERSFNVISQQSIGMANYLDDKEGRLPRSYVADKDEIITSDSKWWCSGFFPGVLWYLYEYSGDSSHRGWAEKYSARVESEKYNTYDHDIGFQIYCSFGNGYRLTGRDDYREVLKVAGKSALERYNPQLGVIRSWGLYGYVVMFRETKLQRYYDQAVAIANLMTDHENMPEDGIPYWDYLAPGIPGALRDASAGAIMASALIELSTLTSGDLSGKYLSFAEKQLTNLSSPEYLAEPGTNGFFILKRSVGHLPGKSEVDVPLTYADYYFTEAMLRYKNLKGW